MVEVELELDILVTVALDEFRFTIVELAAVVVEKLDVAEKVAG